MTPEAAWAPDPQLVPAIVAGRSSTRMADLPKCDRVWTIVALYDDEDLTADDIAARLECSLRSVRTLLSDAAATFARLLRAETEAFQRTNDMSAGEIARLTAALSAVEAERDRYRLQLAQLIAVALAERDAPKHRCGCPMTRYNTYVSPTGAKSCREHRRLAVVRHRAKVRQASA